MDQTGPSQSSDETPDRKKRTRKWTAAFMVSGLILMDVVLELLCARFPLLFYLIVAGFGYALGGPLSRWAAATSLFARFARASAKFIVFLGILGAIGLTFLPSPFLWESKCTWRQCGRVLGMGLTQSPFPAPPINCNALHRCANEYRYTKSGYQDLLKHMEKKGCEPP